MKLLKRLLLIFGIFFLILVGLAIAFPIIYKDQIVERTKTEINNNVRAEVDFQDVSLSLFKHFPKLTFSINGLSVDGIDEFEGVPLASSDKMEVAVNLASVFNTKKPFEVSSFSVVNPEINVIVTKDGKANYDITVPKDERIEETTQEGDYSAFKVQLKKYSIENATITYDDQSGDIYLKIEDLDHNGSGDFTMDVFDLSTKTTIDKLNFSYGGISYLKNAKVDYDAGFKIEQSDAKYSFLDNELKLNELLLNAEGFVQMKEEDILMDVAFSSPQNSFKNLWSLIPNAYLEGYEDVDVQGAFELSGNVKGTYNEAGSLPGFAINAKAENGNVKYPDLPLGISSINANVKVNSPENDMDGITVDIPRFSMRIGDNPFDGKFHLSTPISDPAVDALVNGTLDLGALSQAMPIEDINTLTGIIDANVRVKARMSQLENEAYDEVDVRGEAEVNKMVVEMAGYPKVNVETGLFTFKPQAIEIDNVQTQLGKSDLSAEGQIDNYMAWFSPNTTMRGSVKAHSNYFNIDEWMPEESTPSTEESQEEAKESEPAPVGSSQALADQYPFEFKFDATIDKMVYDVYEMTDNKAKGSFAPNHLSFSHVETQLGNSDIAASGDIDGMFDYLFEDGMLTGDIDMESNYFDLNQFMTEDGSVPENSGSEDVDMAEMEPIIIPGNIDMDIDANMRKVVYTNMEIKDIKGRLKVNPDQTVELENTTGRTLGGTIDLDGGYYTREGEEPRFALKYDIQKMGIRPAFETFNTFEKIAPIGKYMNGDFNTNLETSGDLGNDLFPKMNTLNARGFMETLNGVIDNFKPLQAIGNTLNISALKEDVEVKELKTWFTVENGVVTVDPFDYSLKGIDMNVSGSHSLQNEMDYNIKAAIPTEMLQKSGLGNKAIKGLQSLSDDAAKLGLNIGGAEKVNVLINLKGSMTDPKVSVKLLGLDGETSIKDAVTETVQNVIDDKKEEVKAVVDEEKDKLLEQAQEQADKIKAEAKTQADKLRAEGKKAADKVRAEGDDAAEKIRAEARKQAESIKDKAQKEADKAVAEAKNPLAKIAAQKVADRLVAEAAKKADDGVVKADAEAVKVEQKAEGQAQNLEAKAETNAKKVEDTAEQKADKIMADARAKAG